MEEEFIFAWADDGSTRSGSDSTSFRVVTEETKRSMPSASADNFHIPLYAGEFVGWAYKDKHKEYWHLCRDKPACFGNREVRKVFIPIKSIEAVE